MAKGFLYTRSLQRPSAEGAGLGYHKVHTDHDFEYFIEKNTLSDEKLL
jgi:hypothetical protein